MTRVMNDAAGEMAALCQRSETVKQRMRELAKLMLDEQSRVLRHEYRNFIHGPVSPMVNHDPGDEDSAR